MVAGFQVAGIVAGVSAALCVTIAIASRRVMIRIGNPQLRLVTLAFLLLAAKNIAKCINLAAGDGESGAVELVFSLIDVTAVGLIAYPLLSRRMA
jgi:hypothetical protein